MTEGYASLENMIKYYGTIENGRIIRYGAQIPFNFQLISNTNMGTKANDFKTQIESWLKSMPQGNKIQANWVVGFQIPNKIQNMLYIVRFSCYFIVFFFLIPARKSR